MNSLRSQNVFHILLTGLQSQIDAALVDIQHKFPSIDTSKQYIEGKQTPSDVILPEISTVRIFFL